MEQRKVNSVDKIDNIDKIRTYLPIGTRGNFNTEEMVLMKSTVTMPMINRC
jgi:hypothetical protein